MPLFSFMIKIFSCILIIYGIARLLPKAYNNCKACVKYYKDKNQILSPIQNLHEFLLDAERKSSSNDQSVFDDFAETVHQHLKRINKYYQGILPYSLHERMCILILSILNIHKAHSTQIDPRDAQKIGNILTHIVNNLPKSKFRCIIETCTPKKDFCDWISKHHRYPGDAYGKLLNALTMRVEKERVRMIRRKKDLDLYDKFLSFVALAPWGRTELLTSLFASNSPLKFCVLSRLLCNARHLPPPNKYCAACTQQEPQQSSEETLRTHEVYEALATYAKDNRKDPDLKEYYDLVLSRICLISTKTAKLLLTGYPGRPITPQSES